MSTPFSEDVVAAAFRRSGGRCECTRSTCGTHFGRCSNLLDWRLRGRETSGGWEAHHIVAGGPSTLSNCEILCIRCHKNTGSYGR